MAAGEEGKMMNGARAIGWLALCCVLLAGCGGGGGVTPARGVTPTPSATTSPTPSASSTPAAAATTVPLSQSGQTVTLPASGGYSGTMTVAANNAPSGTTMTLTDTVGAPAGDPQPDSRKPSSVRPLAFTPDTHVLFTQEITVSQTTTFNLGFSEAVDIPNSISDAYYYCALFAGSGSLAPLIAMDPATANAQAITCPARSTPITLTAGVDYWFELLGSSSSPPTIRGDLFVANYANNTVTEYPAGDYGTSSPAVLSAGVRNPTSLGLDSSRDLFVVNSTGSSGGTISMYPGGNYTTSSPTIITKGAGVLPGPQSLVLDSTDDLFVADPSYGAVVEYPGSNYLTASPTVISAYINNPQAIAVDSSSNLFVANYGSSVINEYPAGNYTTFSITQITSNVARPSALALDSSNDLFVANCPAAVYCTGGAPGTGTVTEYPAGNYKTASPTVITAGVNDPAALIVDSAGDLFVADFGNGTVTEYPAGNYTTASPTIISAGVAAPIALALDSSNDLFVANQGNNTVTEYPAGNYTTSAPTVISTGINQPSALAIVKPL